MKIDRGILPAVCFFVAFLAFGCAARGADYGTGNAVLAAEVLPAGRVKAMPVTAASQLIGGHRHEGLVGDFKMYNSRVGFVISGARMSSGMDPYGGMVEEAGLLRKESGAYRWRNLLGDFYFAFYQGGDPMSNGRLFQAKKAWIVKDGTDGTAIVRIEGGDAEFPTRKEIFLRASKPIDVPITVDYILKPDSTSLEIKASIRNTGEKAKTVSVGQLFLMGDGAPLFMPGCGFDMDCFRGKKTSFVAAAGDGVSYGWFTPGGTMDSFEQMENLMVVEIGRIKTPAGGDGSITTWFTMAPGGVSPLVEQKLNIEKDNSFGTITGRCTERGSGKAVSDADVYALTPDGKVVNEADCADGKYSLALPPGDYVVQSGVWERDDPQPVKTTVARGSENKIDFTFGGPAFLDFQVRDEKGHFIPAAISFVSIGGKPNAMAPHQFRKRKYYCQKIFHKTEFTKTGVGRAAVRPGKYEIYFSRGLEYETAKVAAGLEEGDTTKIMVAIKHSVDTNGYLCGDFHHHTGTSHDADDSPYDTVLGLAGMGLDVIVSTDHDRLTDYRPYIADQRLGHLLNSIVGQEITTKRMGHFNAFPLEYRPAEPNEGAIDWMGLKIPDMFAAVRKSTKKRTLIQVNHPRDSMFGWTNFISYDPKTGTARDKANFSLNFDAFEVMNSNNYDFMEKQLIDWFGFLNRGKRVTATGNSDSHSIYALDTYPLNCVESPTDNPDKMIQDGFIAAVLAQKSTIDGGPFIRITADGKAGPGDTVTDTDGSVDLHINVQAPTWIGVTKLTIYANGEVLETIPLKDTASATRYDEIVKVHPSKDTWYVARADGEKLLFPVYPGAHAFGLTNPVYIDADGNGKFDAPVK